MQFDLYDPSDGTPGQIPVSAIDHIDRLFASPERIPQWAQELRDELSATRLLCAEIRESLRTTAVPAPYPPAAPKRSDRLMDFVNEFRRRMAPDTLHAIYPEVTYEDRRLGISARGYLYNKDTAYNLTRQEAYIVYRYFYEHADDLDKLIRYHPNDS